MAFGLSAGLAIVDHSKRLIERLQQSLIKITNEERWHTAKVERSGVRLATTARLRDASSSGGTGSGMVLDVAYAVRSVLAKLDLPDGNVHGILMHSTAYGQRDHDHAIANSYATLSELWHYSRPGKCYPGDRGCGLPAFHGNNRTFSSCYFVHLGDDLTDLQFDLATDPIAEYLYTSSFTKAAQFFDQCRQLEYVRWGTELTEPVVRTFGLTQLGGSNSEVPTVVAEQLCRELVFRCAVALSQTAITRPPCPRSPRPCPSRSTARSVLRSLPSSRAPQVRRPTWASRSSQ